MRGNPASVLHAARLGSGRLRYAGFLFKNLPQIVGTVLAFATVGCEKRPQGNSRQEPFQIGINQALDHPEQIANLNANAVRVDCLWAAVEQNGNLDVPRSLREGTAALSHSSFHPLGLLAYGHPDYDQCLFPKSDHAVGGFARFAQACVQALPEVGTWEIWNEWNLPVGMPVGTPPGRPEDYVTLLSKTYGDLKARFPEKIFLGGAVAGIGRKDDWTKLACDAGMLEHLDGFSFHPYVYWMPARKRVPERGLLELVEELKALLAKYPRGKDIPLYVTELGWPTHDGTDGVTLEQQARYLSRAILLLRADPRIRGVWIYNLKNGAGDMSDRECHFGLMFSDGSPKPAWFAFRDTANLLKKVRSCRRVDFAPLGYEDELAGVELTDEWGSKSLALWAINESETYQIQLRILPPQIAKSLHSRVLGRGMGPSLPVSAEPDGGKTVLATLSDQPLVIEGTGSIEKIEEVEAVTYGIY